MHGLRLLRQSLPQSLPPVAGQKSKDPRLLRTCRFAGCGGANGMRTGGMWRLGSGESSGCRGNTRNSYEERTCTEVPLRKFDRDTYACIVSSNDKEFMIESSAPRPRTTGHDTSPVLFSWMADHVRQMPRSIRGAHASVPIVSLDQRPKQRNAPSRVQVK